jgi:hypothetical protein
MALTRIQHRDSLPLRLTGKTGSKTDAAACDEPSGSRVYRLGSTDGERLDVESGLGHNPYHSLVIHMSSAFLSYSWDPEPHPTWVRGLSERLRQDGIETVLDQWQAIPGDTLPDFMERAIRENDHVIVVCTPTYKRKADNRQGGVGYEGDIMTGEAFVLKNRRKFVPILRDGEWAVAAPSWLLGTYYVDMRGDNWAERYRLLVDTLHRRLPEPPPVQAQGFKYLPDKSVLDTTSGLVWGNCRATDLVDLKHLDLQFQKLRQESGWNWRLPSAEEVKAVEAAEEYYPRPPILVKVPGHHPFFGNYEKGPWTDERLRNVRGGDRALHACGVFDANRFAGVWSGMAGALNVDAFHMAQEAELLRRCFLLRLVRSATDEDFGSVVSADVA